MTPRARVLVVVLAFFFVICAGAAFLVVRNTLNDTSFTSLHRPACELLTPAHAKTLLDETAQKSSEKTRTKETLNLKTTYCTYTTHGTAVQDTRTVGLEVRAAKTEAGAVENAAHFPPNRSEGRQVPGYGDHALWDPLTGKLSIIKDGNFYLVNVSSGLGTGAAELSEAQAAAAIIGLKD